MNKTVAELALRYLARNADALTEAERRVLQSAIDRKPLSRDRSQDALETTPLGERVADSIARIGGSWGFIISFLLFLFAWAAINTMLLSTGAFDPYPYVFLNLILSMLAAIQAPVIMMSQNRQTERDRLDAAHDYEVNLKSEIEIMALHEKMDELRHRELIGMTERLEALASQISRLEATLPGRGPAA
ncbi:MAG: DUF1003 domain-containing protein [Mesorhizobium sp.]|jgi:uncharacterized membrane protein